MAKSKLRQLVRFPWAGVLIHIPTCGGLDIATTPWLCTGMIALTHINEYRRPAQMSTQCSQPDRRPQFHKAHLRGSSRRAWTAAWAPRAAASASESGCPGDTHRSFSQGPNQLPSAGAHSTVPSRQRERGRERRAGGLTREVGKGPFAFKQPPRVEAFPRCEKHQQELGG
jgi:hypothetical protein